MWRCVVVLMVVALAGCQSTHEQMVNQGYPPGYADGFKDGCGSGREAAGVNGFFRKDVPRYLNEKVYATGWDDGFRQCQASASAQPDQSDWSVQHGDDRERAWQQQKTQGEGRAYHP